MQSDPLSPIITLVRRPTTSDAADDTAPPTAAVPCRQSLPLTAEEIEDYVAEYPDTPSLSAGATIRSARRYQPSGATRPVVPPPTAIVPCRQTRSVTVAHTIRPKRRIPPLWWVGMGMVLIVLGLALAVPLASWWQTTQDDWSYGRPRTMQYDVVLRPGQQPSHFIALNLNGHIEVIEIPQGDATKETVLLGPVLQIPDAALLPVTLEFREGTHDHLLDLLLQVGEGDTLHTWVFVQQQQGGFRPATPGEVQG